LPPTCHTFSIFENISFYGHLGGVKVLQRYSSNIKSLVVVEYLEFLGLKSHDFRVLLHDLLPIAIRDILPKIVRQVATWLCIFFNFICRKIIDHNTLDDFENKVVIVLCQLYMCFSPSFFDIMVHLTILIVMGIRICSPVI